jgi:hypothetical protein
MDMESINGLITANTEEIGKVTKYQDMGSISGVMGGLIKATGLRITCTGKVSTLGQMEGSMRDSILTTRSMDMESTPILMEDLIEESGLMENSKERAYSSHLKVPRGKVFGRRERALSGWTKRMIGHR